MLDVDLHVHSLFSACGLHTILELLQRGRAVGLKAMAITDHGPGVGEGRLTSVFFERFRSPFHDIRLYKGLELNVMPETGKVDVMWQFMPFIDILLMGVHPNLKSGLSKEYYTDLAIAALESHPFIDILTHPNDPNYPLDYRRIAETAKRLGMAIELNNSKVLYNRSTAEEALELISVCREVGCLMAVNSDTHAIMELGSDEAVRPLLEKAGFPAERIVNRSLEAAGEFIESRRALKRTAVRPTAR
jgi:putative hydrolase